MYLYFQKKFDLNLNKFHNHVISAPKFRPNPQCCLHIEHTPVRIQVFISILPPLDYIYAESAIMTHMSIKCRFFLNLKLFDSNSNIHIIYIAHI